MDGGIPSAPAAERVTLAMPRKRYRAAGGLLVLTWLTGVARMQREHPGEVVVSNWPAAPPL